MTAEAVPAAPGSTVDALTAADIEAFERDAKIGLLATVNPQGQPHLTLITSLQARGPRELMFGQFTEGVSKAHVRANPRAGFLVMGPDGRVWHGRARWTRVARSGADYELYNQKPMFRYNAYFGIHAVHYLDVIAVDGRARISAGRLAAGALALRMARLVAGLRRPAAILNPWTQRHLARIKTLKFASWVDDDGFPVIAPPVACRPVDRGRLLLRPIGRDDELVALTVGQTVAVFGVNLATESVLVRGRFAGWRRYAGVMAGCLDVDWVYNSMPPKPGQIYPFVPLRPIVFGRATT